jgi:hypothetical protein
MSSSALASDEQFFNASINSNSSLSRSADVSVIRKTTQTGRKLGPENGKNPEAPR